MHHTISSDHFNHDAIKIGDSSHRQLYTMYTSTQCHGELAYLSMHCIYSVSIRLQGLILQDVFDAKNPYYVAFLTGKLFIQR